jgi:hypothetical protein
MGTIFIVTRGLGKPAQQISIATHIHSWYGRLYLLFMLCRNFPSFELLAE